ncbi:carbohydrate kinase family protein [Nocardia sp. BMG51109]|uniref:carbohydrate kinase family protein n=1 Tax=Nocardia sp. BMG51109 TaxID=1056816 RepID=UPI000466D0DB|nr:carbohydrate kinase family protein [Nocardia sp. BMG51109]
MTLQSGPVVCVSYLALAELWTVPQFPRANHGAEVRSIERSVAADGPTTAAALAALGAPTLLAANDIGSDDHGTFVRQWLEERAVECAFTTRPEVVTPRTVVAADDDHTRTWFAHLPGVAASLEQVDLAPIAAASFLYVDCYEIIEQATIRVIDAGRTTEVPMLLNLGGSDLSESVATALRGHPHLLIQTNVDDTAHEESPALARSLLAQTSARWVIVTAGAFGAVAVSRSEQTSVPAFPVTVRHTHCAGAAFSGGLLYGLRAGWSMQLSMLLGSASGALQCARHQNAPLPSLAELQALIASRQQFAAS